MVGKYEKSNSRLSNQEQIRLEAKEIRSDRLRGKKVRCRGKKKKWNRADLQGFMF